MGLLWILLGSTHVVTSRPRTLRVWLLGGALVLVGCVQLLEPGSGLQRALSWLAWPALLAALVACWCDGTLARTFRCGATRAPSAPSAPSADERGTR